MHSDQKPHKRTYTVLGFLGVLGLIVLAFALRRPEQDTRQEAAIPLPPLQVTDIHSGLDYALDKVARIKLVPPVFLSSIKVNLDRLLDVDEKKRTFFRIMLPHTARENGHILAERAKILSNPDNVPDALYDKYEVEHGNVKELLKRVDVVPTSLVLSQAAVESGWGTSRFARDGNNFFGMRTYNKDSKGLDPKEAEGFKVMIFSDIAASVRAYMKNLNTNSAYAEFRNARAENRARDEAPSGRTMLNFLSAYSEIPEKYATMLRGMMERNKLERFDGVRLDTTKRPGT